MDGSLREKPMRRVVVLSLALALPSLALAAPGERPGARFSIKTADLPKPYATDAVDNSSETVPRPAGIAPSVPAGFRAALFAEGLTKPRFIAIAPNGDV